MTVTGQRLWRKYKKGHDLLSRSTAASCTPKNSRTKSISTKQQPVVALRIFTIFTLLHGQQPQTVVFIVGEEAGNLPQSGKTISQQL